MSTLSVKSISHPDAANTIVVNSNRSLSITANVAFEDSDRLTFGAGSDLQIYSNGTDSFIDNGGGNLYIRDTDYSGDIYIQPRPNENAIVAYNDSSVALYYDNSLKLSTTSSGIAVTGNTLAADYLLDAIDATIADTAVDVFVYDTSKDSDGGAWRKRTQHNSWYNETLNTSTRGSRREFPSVAVIVAESDTVTIYDGDDPLMPMWMVFNSDNRYMVYAPCSLGSVTALNGILCYGDPGSAAGAYTVNFISELSNRYGTAGKDTFTKQISGRNSVGWNNAFSSPGIVNWYVNDVSMTVLPNAPIDSATGLPVPTIAVATNGGISIIENDGTVTSSASNTTYRIHEVNLLSTGELYHRQGSGSNEGVNYNNPYSRISGLDLGTYANSTTFWYAVDGVGNASNILGSNSISPNCVLATEESTFHVGDAQGLSNILVNSASINNGMVNWVTKDYNTGWMNGDIKLATLSDTDDTDVTGSNTLSGDAASDDTNAVGNWTGQSGATATVNSNGTYVTSGSYSIRISGSGAGAGAAYYETGILTIGKTYTLSFDMNSADGDGAQWQVGYTNAGNQYGSKDGIISAGNTWYPQSLTFTAVSTDFSVLVFEQGGANSPDIYVDNLQLRLSEEDRSVNGNGLQVFGTVTKTPVATGADLVAYSGFSSSNYLLQPYNSDLDFTGDFSITFWYYHVDVAANEYIVFRAPFNNGTPKTEIYLNAGNQIGCYINDMGGINVNDLSENVWHHISVVRESGTVRFYVNGEQKVTGSSSVDLTNTSAILSIGKRTAGEFNGINGKLALFRMSSTAPSAEQIKKIYEDEKVLFQENAQATLYGSSDAVTALAYDDSTELLHVGTSAGRSMFQGLRRVDNTTDAVGTAISAVNGMVVEE
jgi:hypothetical protein